MPHRLTQSEQIGASITRYELRPPEPPVCCGHVLRSDPALSSRMLNYPLSPRLLKKVQMQGGARCEVRGVLSRYVAAPRERANVAGGPFSAACWSMDKPPRATTRALLFPRRPHSPAKHWRPQIPGDRRYDDAGFCPSPSERGMGWGWPGPFQIDSTSRRRGLWGDSP